MKGITQNKEESPNFEKYQNESSCITIGNRPILLCKFIVFITLEIMFSSCQNNTMTSGMYQFIISIIDGKSFGFRGLN